MIRAGMRPGRGGRCTRDMHARSPVARAEWVGHGEPMRPCLAILLAASLVACAAPGTEAPDADGGRADLGMAVPDDGAAPRTPVFDIPYDESAPDDPLRMLDVYPPPTGAGAPVVVWVHGGAWALGDKRNQLADKIPFFASEGYLFVSVNYRLSPSTAGTPTPEAVRHPTHAEDVARAVAWVRVHAGEFGGDGARIALLGHSAGAHLVSLVATSPTLLAAHGLGPSDVRCTGSLDTEGYDVTAVLADATGMQRAIYLNAFGSDPAVWVEASPITHVRMGAGIGAFLIARRGTAARQATANAFRDALVAAGVAAQVVDVDAYTHEGVNDAVGQPGETTLTPALRGFFSGCLR